MRKHFTEVSPHLRLLISAAVGIAAAVLPLPLNRELRILLGWCAGSAAFLVMCWWLAVEFDARRTRQRAEQQDQTGVTLFLLMLVSVFASVAAILLLLHQARDLSGMQRTAHVALSMVALALSWLLIQTVYAFRYAHRFYQELAAHPKDEPGLEFPGKQDPDYFDFMYYAHVVGMTAQVSDVVVISREMRRLTLVHSVISFAFNMLILALSINVIAGALA